MDRLEELRALATSVTADTPKMVKEELRRQLYEVWEDASRNEGLEGLIARIGAWRRAKGFVTDWRNVPEKLMLVVTELGETMEAFRHLTEATLEALEKKQGKLEGDQQLWVDNFEEEIADAFIRLGDLCDALHVDLRKTTCWKMAKNEMRPAKHEKER